MTNEPEKMLPTTSGSRASARSGTALSDLGDIKDDRDVVEPFVERLMLRLRAVHPDVRPEHVTLSIEVLRPSGPDSSSDASKRIRRMLAEMAKEGVVI